MGDFVEAYVTLVIAGLPIVLGLWAAHGISRMILGGLYPKDRRQSAIIHPRDVPIEVAIAHIKRDLQ